ncbi:hypothetical protein LOK49_LG02G02378 [Camellia lanceoleosa]|uniref:Uncharacterized protein n=1 Tax=Camellia lanceoleosa TaxID=1840588 RepID=A0ACC0ITQ2_9ERIC|nr:hypothetical protein LOK49_LG02G02378 [Camellia lanceoleosa]
MSRSKKKGADLRNRAKLSRKQTKHKGAVSNNCFRRRIIFRAAAATISLCSGAGVDACYAGGFFAVLFRMLCSEVAISFGSVFVGFLFWLGVSAAGCMSMQAAGFYSRSATGLTVLIKFGAAA